MPMTRIGHLLGHRLGVDIGRRHTSQLSKRPARRQCRTTSRFWESSSRTMAPAGHFLGHVGRSLEVGRDCNGLW
jgi:hypothetical protein